MRGGLARAVAPVLPPAAVPCAQAGLPLTPHPFRPQRRNCSYVVIGICYFAVAVAGFAMFGNTVTGNVLQSIP